MGPGRSEREGGAAAGSRRGATLAGGPALARERVSRVRRERAAVLGLASVAGRAVERCWAGRKSQLGRAGRALGQRSEGLGRLLVFWAGFSFLFLFYFQAKQIYLNSNKV